MGDMKNRKLEWEKEPARRDILGGVLFALGLFGMACASGPAQDTPTWVIGLVGTFSALLMVVGGKMSGIMSKVGDNQF